MRVILAAIMVAGMAQAQLTVMTAERGSQKPSALVVTNVTLDASAFATAAQGAKADTALQSEADTNALTQLSGHVNRTDNPHSVTADQAGAVSTNTTITVNGQTGTLSSNLTFTVQGGAITNVEVVCAGGYRNSTYWYLNYEDVFRTYSAVSSVVTNGDLVTSNFVASAVNVDKQMSVSIVRGFPDCGDVVWSCSPTNNASIDASGKLTMIGQGSTVVTGTLCDQAKTITVPLYVANAGEPFSTSYIVADSLRYIASTNLDAMIVGGTSTYHRSYWSTIDHAVTNYVRDTDCWAKDIDLSGVVVSTGGGTPYWHGTLVTSQHIAMAKHAYNGVGTVKRFVGASGTVYTRTITALRDPWPGMGWLSGDVIFGKLDSALPTNDVCVYAVLPASYTNQLPNGLANTPCLIYDQSLRCLVADLLNDYSHKKPIDATRAQFYSLPYVGDSGRPTFLILPNAKPIFLHMFTFATAGTSLVTTRDALNAALAIDGVSLTEADLSGYPTF